MARGLRTVGLQTLRGATAAHEVPGADPPAVRQLRARLQELAAQVAEARGRVESRERTLRLLAKATARGGQARMLLGGVQ